MLAARVAAGKLPPVEKRLPAVPFVRQVAKIGRYGGTLYDQAESPGGRFHLDGTLIVAAQETDTAGRTIRPHLCDVVDTTPDFRGFTFHIREGLKWSDGVDLTAEDILWWWWNEARNTTIFPEGPRTFKVGDDYAQFAQLDRLTFRIAFREPFRPCLNLSASEYMAFGSYFGQPAHWMKQFHADFNPDANKIAQQHGFAAWYQYYMMVREYMHPVVNKPHVAPWVRVSSTTTHDIYERNPYFFEVDQEGNQLPYIDRLFVQVVEDERLQEARRATGSVSEGVCDMSQISIFTKNALRGNYSIRHWHLADGCYREWVCRAGNQDCTCWNRHGGRDRSLSSVGDEVEPTGGSFLCHRLVALVLQPGKIRREAPAGVDRSIRPHGCLVQRQVRRGIQASRSRGMGFLQSAAGVHWHSWLCAAAGRGG